MVENQYVIVTRSNCFKSHFRIKAIPGHTIQLIDSIASEKDRAKEGARGEES